MSKLVYSQRKLSLFGSFSLFYCFIVLSSFFLHRYIVITMSPPYHHCHNYSSSFEPTKCHQDAEIIKELIMRSRLRNYVAKFKNYKINSQDVILKSTTLDLVIKMDWPRIKWRKLDWKTGYYMALI
ncbi:Uncharacterized protein TCM_027020 [Theobroma cacao]|uniref:Uncharacterized protein n=1 Tax=Theobroma cacao TaxID=3641 RepID=A0A061G8A6_THECC|nr:Uncharacterized protein TCM_027020 [Theobroma cacao]